MLALMLVIAPFYWGGGEPPACGTPTAIYRTRVTGHMAADADPVRCRIRISRAVRELPRREFCAVMIHEVGHLYGHEHSADPTDVMFPSLLATSVPRLCVRLFG